MATVSVFAIAIIFGLIFLTAEGQESRYIRFGRRSIVDGFSAGPPKRPQWFEQLRPDHQYRMMYKLITLPGEKNEISGFPNELALKRMGPE